MNTKKITTNDVLSLSQMNNVKGGGIIEDMYYAYETAKGTPVSSTSSISKPTSVRGDELVTKTVSTISTIGTAVGATTQDIYVATSVTLAALPYLR